MSQTNNPPKSFSSSPCFAHEFNDKLRTPLCDLLECQFPIIQAGMGGVARSELVAAVSAAGGFGCLGMVRESPDLIASEIAKIREITVHPFGVNLIPSSTEPALFEAELDACIEAKVHTLIYFWDVVPAAIEKAKAAGCRVIYQVGSVEAALQAEAAGADAIIAQGVEAGGHIHGCVSSLVLLPQLADALKIPLIGSGGFASGASLLAALALGAQGIHCGTAFLATHESFAHDLHKQKIVDAQSTDTVYTDAFAINWPADSPVRVIANQVTAGLGEKLLGYDPDQIGREVIADEEGRPIYLFSTDSPLKSMTGDLDRLALFSGQVAGQINQLQSAKEVVTDIMDDASERLTKICTH